MLTQVTIVLQFNFNIKAPFSPFVRPFALLTSALYLGAVGYVLFNSYVSLSSKLRLLKLLLIIPAGRDEISRAASHIVDGVASDHLTVDDIDAHLVSQALELTEPEMLVRTSGEVRLSDFMLWQVGYSELSFLLY